MYSNIIKKLDTKNELPSSSKKRKRKCVPKKRKNDIFADENSDVNETYENEDEELTSRSIGKEMKTEHVEIIENGEGTETSPNTTVVYTMQPIQMVHLV